MYELNFTATNVREDSLCFNTKSDWESNYWIWKVQMSRHEGVPSSQKKAGLTGKKRPVWRAEGKSEDTQKAGRCFTDTFIIRFPARHFAHDKRAGRSFEEAFPFKTETKVVAQKL